MDCKTARLLFDYHRPSAGELDPAEVEALEDHLAGCLECDALHRADRQADARIGQAMTDVAVPARLKDRIVARLAAERASRARGRRRQYLRVAAAAAVLLACAWGGYRWYATHLRPFDVENLWQVLRFNRPNEESVQSALRRLGHGDAVPPPGYDYAFLVSYGVTDFEGQQVPQLVFVRNGVHARVYILTARRFDLSNLKDFQPEDGYSLRIVVRPENDQAYLVVHTGEDLNWLKAHDAAG